MLYRLTPYRPAQRSLGDCIHETAKFLRIKSALYDTTTNLDDEYHKLVEQQVVVNEKQDAVRELLFKNRELAKEPTRTGRLLVLTFTDTVDLYEQIMATWYDYASLRERFAATGILDEVSLLIKNIADDLDHIGQAVQSNASYKKRIYLTPGLEKIKTIGDGYMVVSGVNYGARNGAEAIAEFALEVLTKIQRYAREREFPLALSRTPADVDILPVCGNPYHRQLADIRHSLEN